MSDTIKLPTYEEIQQAMRSGQQLCSQEAIDKLEVLLQYTDVHCTPPQYLPLTPVRVQSASVYASKLGGIPYLPKDMEYPKVLEGYTKGKPLRLLAQLNFSALPHVEGFPQKGILQIFAGYEGDTMYGYDDVDQTYPNGFRVIYHENILEDPAMLLSADEMPDFGSMENCSYPFTGEFLLEAGACGLSSTSPAYDHFLEAIHHCCIQAAVTCYDDLFGDTITPENVAAWWKILERNGALCEAVYAMCCPQGERGTRIGGYPFCTQGDPRAHDSSTRKLDTLLFQLDSEGRGDDEILWSDCGIANFFISAADLAKCDFSQVMYTWDCS